MGVRAETIETISEWATSTFGSNGTDESVCARAFTELAELNFALVNPSGRDPAKIRDECADVYIVLARLCTRRGVQQIADQWMEDEYFWLKSTCELDRLVRDASAFLLGLQGGRDTKICLSGVLARMMRICAIMGGDLYAEVDRKMVVNRGRTWQLDGSGHGQHVP